MASVTCPYHPTPREKAVELLRAAELREGEMLYDLGCGEGNILLAAAEEFGARCVGIEIDPHLAEKARGEVEKRGLEERVTIICDDIFSSKYWAHLGDAENMSNAIRKADVVAIYLNFEVHEILRPMLEKELRDGARVVSYEFYMRGWKEVKDIPMIFVFEKGKSF
jgi:ribosomal protein L11 methylase PrmA